MIGIADRSTIRLTHMAKSIGKLDRSEMRNGGAKVLNSKRIFASEDVAGKCLNKRLLKQ